MRTAKLIIIIISTLFMTSCVGEPVIFSDTAFALDTIIQIKIYYKNSKNHNEDIFNNTFAMISDLENILSVYIEGSDIYKVKENAGIMPVEVSPIVYDVVRDSLEYSKITDGLFDVTAGPLIDLWAIDPPYGYVPTQAELDEILPLIDYNQIDLSKENQIYLLLPDLLNMVF